MYELDEKIITVGLGKYRNFVYRKCKHWNGLSKNCPVCFLDNVAYLFEEHWHKELFVVLDLSDENSVRNAIEYNNIFHMNIDSLNAGFSVAIIPEEQLLLSSAKNIFENFDRVVCFRSISEIFCFTEMMSFFAFRDGFIGLDMQDFDDATEWKKEGYITKTVFCSIEEMREEIACFAKTFFRRFKEENILKVSSFVVMELPQDANIENIFFITDTVSAVAETENFIFQVYFNEKQNNKSATVYLLSGEI